MVEQIYFITNTAAPKEFIFRIELRVDLIAFDDQASVTRVCTIYIMYFISRKSAMLRLK